MNESNRQTLQDALRRLDQQQPSRELWDRIEADLARPTPEELQPDTLCRSLRQLPRYRAPEPVWLQIEARLARPRRALLWAGGLAAALSLLVALGLSLRPAPPAMPPSQASERRPDRELSLDPPQVADFPQPLTPQEEALLTCLQEVRLAPEDEARLNQLRRWAARQDSLAPAAADSLQQRRAALVQMLHAQYCQP